MDDFEPMYDADTPKGLLLARLFPDLYAQYPDALMEVSLKLLDAQLPGGEGESDCALLTPDKRDAYEEACVVVRAREAETLMRAGGMPTPSTGRLALWLYFIGGGETVIHRCPFEEPPEEEQSETTFSDLIA